MDPPCPGRVYISDSRKWFQSKTEKNIIICQACYNNLAPDKTNYEEFPEPNQLLNCDYPHEYSSAINHNGSRIFILDSDNNNIFNKTYQDINLDMPEKSNKKFDNIYAEFNLPTCSHYKILFENLDHKNSSLSIKNIFINGHEFLFPYRVNLIEELSDYSYIFISNKLDYMVNFEIIRSEPLIKKNPILKSITEIRKQIGNNTRFTIKFRSLQDPKEIKTINQNYLEKITKIKQKLNLSITGLLKQKQELKEQINSAEQINNKKKIELGKLEYKLVRKINFTTDINKQINSLA